MWFRRSVELQYACLKGSGNAFDIPNLLNTPRASPSLYRDVSVVFRSPQALHAPAGILRTGRLEERYVQCLSADESNLLRGLGPHRQLGSKAIDVDE